VTDRHCMMAKAALDASIVRQKWFHLKYKKIQRRTMHIINTFLGLYILFIGRVNIMSINCSNTLFQFLIVLSNF